jgi:hypothetical protein
MHAADLFVAAGAAWAGFGDAITRTFNGSSGRHRGASAGRRSEGHARAGVSVDPAGTGSY